MEQYSLSDCGTTSDRYKLFLMPCKTNEMGNCIAQLYANGINAVNVGRQLAEFVSNHKDPDFLDHDIIDYFTKLLDTHKSKTGQHPNYIVAAYNLGILLEPSLNINAPQILKECSRSQSLIILWENEHTNNGYLFWSEPENNITLDFTDIKIKTIRHEI